MMDIDKDLLVRFENGLDPRNPQDSEISATILGYGEISAIFQIGDHADIAYKRMPLFADCGAAETYEKQYYEYCGRLKDAGLTIPPHKTVIVQIPGRPVVIYIAQAKLPVDCFVHKLIHTLDSEKINTVLERVVAEIEKIWCFNHAQRSVLELAIDGQLSNWVWLENGGDAELLYIDTSTPLYRKKGVEQLNPELLLQSAPSFLRWIIRLFFLKDVMNRYYDPRLVYMDLAGNLFKEQRHDLIATAVDIINRCGSSSINPLRDDEVEKYYKEDKIIWALFLGFRRIDRWLKTRILRKRYEFILRGKIER